MKQVLDQYLTLLADDPVRKRRRRLPREIIDAKRRSTAAPRRAPRAPARCLPSAALGLRETQVFTEIQSVESPRATFSGCYDQTRLFVVEFRVLLLTVEIFRIFITSGCADFFFFFPLLSW